MIIRKATVFMFAIMLALSACISTSCSHNHSRTNRTVDELCESNSVDVQHNADDISNVSVLPQQNVESEDANGAQQDKYAAEHHFDGELSHLDFREPLLSCFYIGGSPMHLPDSITMRVSSALNNIQQRGECSFVAVNIDSGAALSYNPDAQIYTASSIKAAMVYYILTETDVSLLTDTRRKVIEAAIIQSDNESYNTMQNWYYFDGGFVEWLKQYGVEHEVYDVNGAYPYAGAANMIDIWADIAAYISTDSDDALWFRWMLQTTQVSFIKETLPQDKYDVASKAGWITEDGINATNDCAFIVSNTGSRYVICILTSQPSHTPASTAAVGELARALLDTLEQLHSGELPNR